MPARVLTTHPRDAQLQSSGTITGAPAGRAAAQAMADENGTVSIVPDTGGAAGVLTLLWWSSKIGQWIAADNQAIQNPVANTAYTFQVPPRVLLAVQNPNGGTVWFGGVLDTLGNIIS